MKHTCSIEMDNEQGERCNVGVCFLTDSYGKFDGFISIQSNKPIYDVDLAHLEQFVLQSKDRWVDYTPF